ncbi:MAG: hypothetical protein ACKN9P_12090, partial [Phenylobacterium sp.]
MTADRRPDRLQRARNRIAGLALAVAGLLATGFGLLATPVSAATPTPPFQEMRCAAVVVDAETGEVLFSRRGDSLRYPASITKVMTLYL